MERLLNTEEHAIHVGDTGSLPTTDVLIEVFITSKKATHINYVSRAELNIAI